MKKIYSLTTLAGVSLLLGACTGGDEPSTAEDASTAIDSMQAQKETLISSANEILELERDLQIHFEEDLASDEEGTLSEGSGQVAQNIEQREQHLDSMTEAHTQIRSDLGTVDLVLENGEEEELPSDLEDVNDQLLEVESEIASFVEQYSSNLETQAQYFTNIGSEDADFQLLTDGMETINEENESLITEWHNLQDALVFMQETLANFEFDVEEDDESTAMVKGNNV